MSRVWVVTNFDTRIRADEVKVHRTEAGARERVRQWVVASPSTSNLWLTKLAEWDGETDVVIGAFRLRVVEMAP